MTTRSSVVIYTLLCLFYAGSLVGEGSTMAQSGRKAPVIEQKTYSTYGQEKRVRAPILTPEVRQVLIDGDEIRFDVNETVVPDHIFRAAEEGRLRVEDVNTGSALDFDIRLQWFLEPEKYVLPPQPRPGELKDPSYETPPVVFRTSLNYRSDQLKRRYSLRLKPTPAVGTKLRLVIPADSLFDGFSHIGTKDVDQTFRWRSEKTVLLDTQPPAIQAIRLRLGHLEIEFDEEPDLTTLEDSVEVIPVGGSALALSWIGQGDGFTVRTEQQLGAGTFDLKIYSSVQDLAGNSLILPKGKKFETSTPNTSQTLFSAP